MERGGLRGRGFPAEVLSGQLGDKQQLSKHKRPTNDFVVCAVACQGLAAFPSPSAFPFAAAGVAAYFTLLLLGLPQGHYCWYCSIIHSLSPSANAKA